MSLVVLHIPVEYSLSHTLAHTHYNHRHMGGKIHKDKADLRVFFYFFLFFLLHTFVLCFEVIPQAFSENVAWISVVKKRL